MTDCIACVEEVQHFDKFHCVMWRKVSDHWDEAVGNEIDDGEDVDDDVGGVLFYAVVNSMVDAGDEDAVACIC